MRAGAGSAARAVLALAALAVVAAAARARAAAPDVDTAAVLVRSTPGAQPATEITVRVRPDARVEDRTPGARPATETQGPASVGDTFSDEITLFLPGVRLARPAAVEVSDDLVSAVRVFPDAAGTTVVVFVRQPVSYTVSRPSALGEIAVALRGRARPAAAPPPRPARRGADAASEVSVDAESLSYDQATDALIARGSVSLTRGGITLRADEVRYARATGVAEARGNVVLIGPEGTVAGDVARVDLDDETGWVEDASAEFAASGYTLAAGKLEKGVGARYQIDDGVFTTCRCGGLEKPSWSIAGKRTDVNLGGLGVARGAQFRVKDVPVLWLPILPFPVNTDRQTGFLIPRVGYSNLRGFQYEQPFFWAIDKSQDLTLATDVETAARIGIIAEYRYMLSRETRGDFTAAYYDETIRDRQKGLIALTPSQLDIPKNRYVFAGRHDSPFPGGAHHYVDLFVVSDDQFLREINSFNGTVSTGVQLRTTPYTRSRTGVVKTWSGGLALLDATYYQDLIDPQTTVPQRVPQARAEHRVGLLDGRVVARVAAEGVHFQRGEGFDGVRGDVFPELFVPFRLGRALHGSLAGRVRETAYRLTNDNPFGLYLPHDCIQVPGDPTARVICDPATPLTPEERRRARPVSGGIAQFREPGRRVPALDATHTRELAEVRGRLGTDLAHVYDFPHFGFTRVRHSVEPELRWLFVPQVDDQQFERRGPPLAFANGTVTRNVFIERRYLFDDVDAINRRNFFAWGLSTRLLGRGGAWIADEADDEDEESEDEAAVAAPSGPEPPGSLAPQPLEPARELLRVGLWHGYDVSRQLQDDGSHFSDVDLGIRVTPTDLLGLTYDTTWSLQGRQLAGQSLGLVLREPWWTPRPDNLFQGPSSVALVYSQVREQTAGLSGLPLSAGFTRQAAQDVNGSVYLRLGDYLGFQFVGRYDLDGGTYVGDNGKPRQFDPGFLERDYILRFISRCNCWAVEFGVADTANPDERLFRVQVTLLGLGSFGQGTGGNFAGLAGLAGLEQLGYRRPTALGRGYW